MMLHCGNAMPEGLAFRPGNKRQSATAGPSENHGRPRTWDAPAPPPLTPMA